MVLEGRWGECKREGRWRDREARRDGVVLRRPRRRPVVRVPAMTGRRVTPDIVEEKAAKTPPKGMKRKGSVGG